jgi:hypothetical protein
VNGREFKGGGGRTATTESHALKKNRETEG